MLYFVVVEFSSHLGVLKNYCDWYADGETDIPSVSLALFNLGYNLLVAQSWSILCNPMICSLPGSSIHGILQARILKWVDIPFSRGSSQPRDRTQVSCTAGKFFTVWATGKAPNKSQRQYTFSFKNQISPDVMTVW